MNSNLEYVDVTEQVIFFRDFLNSAWPHLDLIMRNHDWDSDMAFIGDWLQVNWEFLIERELLKGEGFLPPFGLAIIGTRMTSLTEKPTHMIFSEVNEPMNDIKNKSVTIQKKLRLFGFSTSIPNGTGLYPPFDLVDLVDDESKIIFVVELKNIRFYLAKIKN